MVGSYVIEELIADGGMGSVHRARHRIPAMAERQGGDVALKLMHPHLARDDGWRQRFDREAEIGAGLDHPGIVRVLDHLSDGDRCGIVMELLRGETLQSRLAALDRPLRWEDTGPLLHQLLQALDYAHARRVVHRDLKPDNIMLDEAGRLRLLDFGISRNLGTNRGVTRAGMGTPAYMAPEQVSAPSGVDGRADLYAVGMIGFRLLHGRLPWSEETSEIQILMDKAAGKVPTEGVAWSGIPIEARAALERSLRAEPAERFVSAGEMLAGLGQQVPLAAHLDSATAQSAESDAASVLPAAGAVPKVPNVSESAGIVQAGVAFGKTLGSAVRRGADHGVGALAEAQGKRAATKAARRAAAIRGQSVDTLLHALQPGTLRRFKLAPGEVVVAACGSRKYKPSLVRRWVTPLSGMVEFLVALVIGLFATNVPLGAAIGGVLGGCLIATQFVLSGQGQSFGLYLTDRRVFVVTRGGKVRSLRYAQVSRWKRRKRLDDSLLVLRKSLTSFGTENLSFRYPREPQATRIGQLLDRALADSDRQLRGEPELLVSFPGPDES